MVSKNNHLTDGHINGEIRQKTENSLVNGNSISNIKDSNCNIIANEEKGVFVNHMTVRWNAVS